MAAGFAEREKTRMLRSESGGAKWTFFGVLGVRPPSSSSERRGEGKLSRWGVLGAETARVCADPELRDAVEEQVESEVEDEEGDLDLREDLRGFPLESRMIGEDVVLATEGRDCG